eukprot:GHRR01003272.1.p2 GENE.GHRR01003272.1~~GHRR01003272.1.p2  ORF type:complete len:158 (+),score=16.85 GHRR01003272.1:1819-2292(+)
MEDWLHWTQTWSVYILIPHNGQSCWILRWSTSGNTCGLASCTSARVEPLPDCAQTADDAGDKQKIYAEAVNEHFGSHICKFNLHVLICRLLYQEGARGKAAYGNEYWVENLIQWVKSVVKGRTTKYPELVLVYDTLTDEALVSWCRQHPADMKMIHE